MTDYTLKNLRSDVEDSAPKHGMDGVEARFAFGAPRTADDSPGGDAEMVPGWWAD